MKTKLSLKRDKEVKRTSRVKIDLWAKSDQEISSSQSQSCSLNSEEPPGTKQFSCIDSLNALKVRSKRKLDVLQNPVNKAKKLANLEKQLDLDKSEETKKVHSPTKRKRPCPSCNKEFELDDLDHWRDCLQQFRLVSSKNKPPTDEDEGDTCYVCKKEFKDLNLLKRLEHLERCLDERDACSIVNSLACPFCRRNLSLQPSQSKHVKQCGKRLGIPAHKLKDTVQLLERQAKEREAFGLSTVHLGRTCLQRNKSAVNTKNLLPKNNQEADLQMAMALSVSLQEKEQHELNKELEELGIPTYQVNISPDVEKKKKGRRNKKSKEKVFSLLLHRTPEDRQRIVNENVARILGNENQTNTVDDCFLSEIFSPPAADEFKIQENKNYSANEFVKHEAPLWNLAALPCDKFDVSDFYVEELQEVVTPNKVKIGRFKRLSQIPGRGSSQPSREGAKSKLEYDDFVNSTQEGLLAVASFDDSSEEDPEIYEHICEGMTSVPPSVEEIDLITVLEANPFEQFAGAFGSLLENELLSDINFITKDGSCIPAHSILFYARCPLLYQEIEQVRLYKSGSQEKIELKWPFVSRSTAVEFLRFIYTNHVQNVAVPKAEILFLLERYGITKRKTTSDRSKPALIHKEVSENDDANDSNIKNNKLSPLANLSNNCRITRGESCSLDCARIIPVPSILMAKQSSIKDGGLCTTVKFESADDQRSSVEETKEFKNSLSSQRNDSVYRMNFNSTPSGMNAKNITSSLCTSSLKWQNNCQPSSTSTPLSDPENPENTRKNKYFSISSINSSASRDVSGSFEYIENDLESYRTKGSSTNLNCALASHSPVFIPQKKCSPSSDYKNTYKKIIEESVFESFSGHKISNKAYAAEGRHGNVSRNISFFNLANESDCPNIQQTQYIKKNTEDEINTKNLRISSSPGDLVTTIELFFSPKFSKSLKEIEAVHIEKSMSVNKKDSLSTNESEELQNCEENDQPLPELNNSDVWEGFNEDGYTEENSIDLFDPIVSFSAMEAPNTVENDKAKAVPTTSSEFHQSDKALYLDISQLPKVKKKRNKSQKEKLQSAATVTPKPEYNIMKTPEISDALKKYGVRKFPRKKAVLILDHIYEKTHPLVTDSEQETSFQNSLDLSSNVDDPAQHLTTSKKDSCENEKFVQNLENCLEQSEESDLPSSQSSFSSQDSVLEESILFRSDNDLPSSQGKNEVIFNAFYNFFVSRNDLYKKILCYQPLDFNEIHAELKAAGIRHSEKILLEYLDQKGITFTMRNGNWKKRRLLKKTKSLKVKRSR